MKKSSVLLIAALILISFLLPATAFAAASAVPSVTAEDIISASAAEPVTVGIIENGAPVSYCNGETLSYEGISVDMMNIISEKTGLRFIYIPVDVSRREQAHIPTDASPAVIVGATFAESISDERSILLSDSLHSDYLCAATLRGTDLSAAGREKTAAVVSGFDAAAAYIDANMPEYTAVQYRTLEECMDAVADGKTDTVVYLRSCISYLMQKPYYSNIELIATYYEPIQICAAGLSENTKPVIDIINSGLHRVTKDEIRSVALNYTVMNPYRMTLKDTLYQYRMPLMIIALLFLFIVAVLAALILIRKRGIRRVEEALKTAEQSSAAKGNFMSRMSHEIRTPLNAVIGYNTIAKNELAEARTDADRKQAEMKVMDCLTKSEIASKHLLSIINDVLDMSAIESGKIRLAKERFDFKGLISSLTAVFYSQAKERGVDFDVRLDSHIEEWVIGDQMRVNQILTNLLSNAVKFTPDGGEVTLFIHSEQDSDLIHVHFEVRDTGIGMSSEQLGHILNPFEQADASISKRFGGTGLGLSITKTLVDLMGGSISVKSIPGEGSAFSCVLPFAKTEQPGTPSVFDFSHMNALVVDDDISTCDYIRLLLTRSGVRSTAVNCGEDALLAVSDGIEKNDPYTMCIVDWRMPKMDGIETVRRIRDIVGESLPIVVLTAYDFSDIAEKAAEVGISMFMSKPLFQSTLFNLLANISERHSPDKPELSPAYDFGGCRVLLAEDNSMNMEIARKILESTGLSVDIAWNGQEAASMFMSAPAGTYQAILMDVQMPIMNGYQATRAIRASEHPEAVSIPIIAMTADAFAENIAESLASGMNAHVSKPIDLTDLFETLQRFIVL